MDDTRFRSRKFLCVAFVLVASFAALGLNWLPPATWFEINKWALGFYMLGNVGDTTAEKVSAWLSALRFTSSQPGS